MGREAVCPVHWEGRAARAKVHLDSQTLQVGPPFRLAIPLVSVRGAEAEGDWVRVRLAEGELRWEVGPSAKTWLKGLLHPPSLLDKWGLTNGQAWQCHGIWPPDLAALLPIRPGAGMPLPLVLLATPEDLPLLIEVGRSLGAGNSLWALAPKRDPALGERLVFQAAQDAGLRPTKVASVSDRWTSHRFTRPKG